MTHAEKINAIITSLQGLFNLQGFTFKTMRRQINEEGRGVLNLKKNYCLAYTNLKTKTITIDIYTPRFRKPKAIKSILNIFAHEIAHHQKPPFRQRWRGKIITRQHYPAFYQQVNKNIEKMQKDEYLQKFIYNNQ